MGFSLLEGPAAALAAPDPTKPCHDERRGASQAGDEYQDAAAGDSLPAR
jgi:hypothetical protein